MTLRRELKRTEAERKALEPSRLAEVERQGMRMLKTLGIWNPDDQRSYCLDGGGVTPDTIMLNWEDAIRLARFIRLLKRQAKGTKR